MTRDDDRDALVFKALADPTRRQLLDQLFERDGRTLTELEADVDMTRFGVMKHLKDGRSCTTSTPSRSGSSTTGGSTSTPSGTCPRSSTSRRSSSRAPEDVSA